MGSKIPENPEDFVIRHAEPADIPLILWFIRALADYEKLSHEVKATEAGLNEYLFGKQPRAEVLIGEYNGKAVGFALFFHNFSTFLCKPGLYLEDLFVVPEHRGKGFGKALLQYLARLAVGRDCGRMEWAVLDWNEPSIRFYESIGARSMNEWIITRLSGEELEDFARTEL
jgi:GNAT superfamily N-acetyltransferase